MLYVAIALFVIAAIFGLIILNAILNNTPTPKPVVLIHGGVAVAALLIVIYFSATTRGPAPVASLTLFLIAAAGGLTLFIFDMLKKPVPKFLAVLHPLIAVCGLLALIVFVIQP